MKIKYLLLATVISFSFCTKQNEFVINKEKKQITVGSKPRLTISYEADENISNAIEIVDFFLLADDYLKKIAPSSKAQIQVKITKDKRDYYKLFFAFADSYFENYENRALLYGLIQLQWEKLISDSFKKTDKISIILRNERYKKIRIDDFSDLFSDNHLNENELEHIYPYAIKYLLDMNNVLFVSLQELMERDIRYFGVDKIDNIFYQVLIVPEITEFSRYIIKRYGYKATIKFVKVAYSQKAWKTIFKEEIGEVEKIFVEAIEKTKFTGKFNQDTFILKIDVLLKLYNTGTKATMFAK